jgi:segregation and condensation protein B
LGTTREFLDYFGLKSLDQLPTLAELKDVETIGVQLELPAGEPAQPTAATEGSEQVAADAQVETMDAREPSAEIEASGESAGESEAADENASTSENPDSSGDDAELMADASDESESDEDGDDSHTLVASGEEESASHEVREPRED